MKASEVTELGFYWLSHDFNDWGAGPEGPPEGWNVVQVGRAVHFGVEQLVLFTVGDDEGIALADLEDHVSLIGPLQPPK